MTENNTSQEKILARISELLKNSHVVLPKNCTPVLYHHLGRDRFLEVGATFFKVVMREYAKIIVCMLPMQSYPLHYHRIKSESFFVLHGDLIVNVDGEVHVLQKGDSIDVERRIPHSFSTSGGCVFEEISTAYVNNDSVYIDKNFKRLNYPSKNTTLNISLINKETMA